MGGLLERREDWAAAAAAWEALAETDGLLPRTLIRASRAAARAGRPDEALRLYTRLEPALLAEMGSTLASLTRKLVKLMRDEFAQGLLDAAVGKARVILGSDPQNVAAHRLLAKAVSSYRKILKEAMAQGDLPRMEDTARRILDIDPNRSDALKVLVKLLCQGKRWAESIEVQERLVALDPGEPRHWQKLATSCRAARRWDLGVAAALRAVELEPGNAKSMDTLSDLLNRQALAA
jgi:tetratricopeptide (TPR) repeat protein